MVLQELKITLFDLVNGQLCCHPEYLEENILDMNKRIIINLKLSIFLKDLSRRSPYLSKNGKKEPLAS